VRVARKEEAVDIPRVFGLGGNALEARVVVR
jgi:hypothetical protein